ncbi:MAG: hypothetical protein WKF77_20730 [Planctomycetaceae bacterium]
MDIWPVLTEGAKTPHDAILLMGTQPGRAAVRMCDWKLLLNPSQKDDEETSGSGEESSGKVELYNFADDIGEANNLAATKPERVKELRDRLNFFLKDAVKPGNPEPANSQKATRRGKKKTGKQTAAAVDP